MKKYRIAIQLYGEKKKVDFRNVIIYSEESIDEIKEKIIMQFSEEYEVFLRIFNERILNKKKKKELKEAIVNELIDVNAVGKDISVEEFVENEKYFALRGD